MNPEWKTICLVVLIVFVAVLAGLALGFGIIRLFL